MNAVIYARYSSERQNELSIDAQIRECNEYAKKKSITIIGKYSDEAISGRTGNRDGFQRMLHDAKKKTFEIVLVHKIDRLARNRKLFEDAIWDLNELGIDVIAVAQDFGKSKEGRLMTGIVADLAQFYSENLAEETRKGHKEVALKGEFNGGLPPFGYDVENKKYVINEKEAPYVKKMFQTALNQDSYKELIREMRAAGIKGKRGKEIGRTQIYEILRNEHYTGVYRYSLNEEENRTDRRAKPNAIRLENAFPAIINKDLFNSVQKILDSRKRAGRKADYLCSGLVYCGNCGAKMHVYKSDRKGHTYYYYRCPEKCGNRTVLLDDVDLVAKKYLLELFSQETQEKISIALRKYKGTEKERTRVFQKALNDKIQEKEKEYDNVMYNFSSGKLPPELIETFSKKLLTLQEEIEVLKNTKPPVDFSGDLINKWLDSLKKNPDRKAMLTFIDRIEVKRDENNKTDLKVESTLKPVLEMMVAGERNIQFQRLLPEILFSFHQTIQRWS